MTQSETNERLVPQRPTVAFSPRDYAQITSFLDAIMVLLKRKHGKTEEEAQVFLKHFVRGHYFNVWRAINKEAFEERTND